MDTIIYVTIRQLDDRITDISGDSALLGESPTPIFEWSQDGEQWTLELQCGWPLSVPLRSWIDRLGSNQGLRLDLIEAEVDVLSGDHLPDDAYWTDTQADVDARKPPAPQEPGTELGVWYRSSREQPNSTGFAPIVVRGAWFGDAFLARKAGQYDTPTIQFRGREANIHAEGEQGFIPNLTIEQKERIKVVRGALKFLAAATDGCHGGQADGIGIVLDETLRS